MSDGTEIAQGFAEAFDSKREIFGPSGSLKILSGPQHATVEATYTTGWELPRKEYDDLALGKKYRKLVVADPDGTRKAKLRVLTAFQVESVIYKNPSKDPHLLQGGGIPVYEFKIYATGERV